MDISELVSMQNEIKGLVRRRKHAATEAHARIREIAKKEKDEQLRIDAEIAGMLDDARARLVCEKRRLRLVRPAKRIAPDPVHQPLFDLWLTVYVRHSKKRFEGEVLSAEEIVDMHQSQKGLCFYSGLPYVLESHRKDVRNDPLLVSIDRVDNEKGYTKDNVVLCALFTNIAKYTWNVVEIRRLWKHLGEH